MIKKVHLVTFLVLISIKSIAQIPTVFIGDNITKRVLYLQNNVGNTASSFVLEKNNKSYVVSAKHFLPNNIENDCVQFSIMQNDRWLLHEGVAHFHKDSNVDILVIELDYNIFGNNKTDYLNFSGQTLIGAEGYFFGYPMGFKSEMLDNKNDGLPIPLFKKCIYSGVITEKGNPVVLLDGNNTPGFSGGPAFILGFTNNEWNYFLMGFIVAYYTQNNKTNINEQQFNFKENSGIIKCIPRNSVKEIMDRL